MRQVIAKSLRSAYLRAVQSRHTKLTYRRWKKIFNTVPKKRGYVSQN